MGWWMEGGTPSLCTGRWAERGHQLFVSVEGGITEALMTVILKVSAITELDLVDLIAAAFTVDLLPLLIS